MRTSELLKDCKIKLKITSDYALAKALKIPTQRISEYMEGKRNPNTYAAVKIAECLGLDPICLIAEFEEMSAKNERERSFWADFQQRAKHPLKGFILALICIASLLIGSGQDNNGGGRFKAC